MHNSTKINVYLQPVEGQDIVYQSGWFDYRDLQTIISKGSLLNGTNVQTWFEQEDLPGNKTKFIYHLKGYVDFQWEQIMPKAKDESYLDKKLEKMEKRLITSLTAVVKQEVRTVVKEEVKKSEESIKTYVDVKIEETKAYIDKKFDDHVRDYH